MSGIEPKYLNLPEAHTERIHNALPDEEQMTFGADEYPLPSSIFSR